VKLPAPEGAPFPGAVLSKHAPQADEFPAVVETAAEDVAVIEAVETDAPAADENKEG
jgi:large subunit ribosomal protein L3